MHGLTLSQVLYIVGNTSTLFTIIFARTILKLREIDSYFARLYFRDLRKELRAQRLKFSKKYGISFCICLFQYIAKAVNQLILAKISENIQSTSGCNELRLFHDLPVKRAGKISSTDYVLSYRLCPK